MIKYKHVCDRCGFETEEEISSTNDGGVLSICPINSGWKVVSGNILCPKCKNEFFKFLQNTK